MTQLLFTLDFHELVRGKLLPGISCMINYDPLRIVTDKSGYHHGDPAYQFTAHVLYMPSREEEIVNLQSAVGILEKSVVELDGTGSMLTGDMKIPDTASELSIWFSVTDPLGNLAYDSEFGANYHFRFITNDIQIEKAVVVNPKDSPDAKLWFSIQAIPEVSSVLIRYRVVNSKSEADVEKVLTLSCQETSGRNRWSNDEVLIPNQAVVAYDILYYIDGTRFKNDNNGNYFIAESA